MRLRVSSRRGAVLISVLIVIVLLSLAAYKYNDLMTAEYRATDSAFRAAQARAHAVSGVHFAAALSGTSFDDSLGGNPWDNAGVFQNVSIGSPDKNGRQGRFSILAVVASDDPVGGGTQTFRYGLCDEASKINVNALLALDKGKGKLGQQILMDLPNMTEDLANCILDWIDPNDPQRTNGAKDEYYSSQSPAYHCKNGPLDSLEEMLLIKGVTPQLLFGNDKNRNGQLDPGEDDGSGQSSLGWSAYLTVYSREANFDSTGKARIYLNNPTLATTAAALTPAVGEELSNFIVAALLYGVTASTAKPPPTQIAPADASAVQSQVQTDQADSTKKIKKLSSLWDLVNATVSVPVGTGQTKRSVSYPSPLNDTTKQQDLFPKLFDTCTTTKGFDLSPRLNINTASPTVIQALKDAFNLQDADVQQIITTRPAPADLSSNPIFKSPGWLLTQANLSVKTIKKLETFVTTRTQVYRFQSVGYADKGGPTARIEAVIDANQGRPRIVYYRDLSELGKAFDIPQQQ